MWKASTLASDPHGIGHIAGSWLASGSSRKLPAALKITDGLFVRAVDDSGKELSRSLVGEIRVSDRVGSIPRRLTFDDGSVFETTDNDAVDDLLKLHRGSGGGFVHKLERFHPRLIIVVALVVALGFALYRFALPIMVEIAVIATPDVVPELMSEATMESLDQLLFEESNLAPDKRSEILRGFASLATLSPRGAAGYKLHFRGGGAIGPNAFALPDGTLVITDELVELAPDDIDMILGVLAHEIGHVHHDHSLRRLYRAAGVAGLILLIGGDIGAGAEDLLVQGSALLALSYSRAHETEADRYSVELMAKAGRDPEAIARFFELLVEKFGDGGDMDFLSTHPATAARIAEARRYAKEVLGK
ncbi:MAG: M48 family metallopeptidase [Rhizobiaceae bacterium]